MLERLQKIIARAGIASRRHAEELIKSGLVTVNGATITELGSKADEAKDHIKVQGKLLRPETERVYLLLNKPPEVVSTMIDPEGRRSLTDLLQGVSVRVFPVGRLEYHSMGLVFLTNDGDLANLMLKAYHLPQTYNLKLKTLLTFEEIEALSQATGAHIVRIKGKDAPWYEVTLSEARRDALRNRLFQTGHPVEKIKRVKIGNLAMESLAAGHFRPLSSAEVTTLRRMVQPGTVQPSAGVRVPAVAGVDADAHASEQGGGTQPALQTSGQASSMLSVQSPSSFAAGRPPVMARRPLLKRRPFQAKPKPGMGKKPARPGIISPAAISGGDFRGERPERAPYVPASAPPAAGGFPNARAGGAAGRPDFRSKSGFGSKPSFGSKPRFGSKPGGGPRGAKPYGEKPRGPWKPREDFKKEGTGGGKPFRGGKPFQKSRPGSFGRSDERPDNRGEQDSDYDRPIKPKSEAPWRRKEFSQPSGSDRGDKPFRGRPGGGRSERSVTSHGPRKPFRSSNSEMSGRPDGDAKFRGGKGARPGAPWKSRQPSEPGAFGRAKSKFSKPGRPAGMKSGGAKRGGPGRSGPSRGGPKRSGGPGQHKPRPGNYSGPKGRR